ncbi:hypothetical protein [Flavobacterium sp. HBTb2-11-1]|uniref:hypothetical protein n=1 Tax=Flavobacterium sp. HBTb2-11-1 TaxID=2692212 RepID=UPI00136D8A1A|nr:hypothetical protein [Flavobacterium sp. HBTb2-11-1]MXO05090.1 hypothetical protein [Flavobacterium sp. HBTb2-11-1]
MKKIAIIILLLTSIKSFSQSLLASNEETIFSFKTKNGKTVLLAKDRKNAYLIYRYGKDNKIELEFPKDKKESWNKFTYFYYIRGGGKANAGLDLDRIAFVNANIEYVIYSDYSAGDFENEESYYIGIRVIDLKTKKETNIKGQKESTVGSMQDFRTNGLLKIDQNRID